MKAHSRVERIFAHAFALQQNARCRNTIYCVDDKVYILNSDDTLLLRFRLRGEERPFEDSLAFEAADYESAEFREVDGKIQFIQKNGSDGFTRKKSCRTPRNSPEQVHLIYRSFGKPGDSWASLPAGVCSMLDERLSHLEVKSVDGVLSLTQRNIYSGVVIEAFNEFKQGKTLGVHRNKSTKDFGPVGIRTNDFLALYEFTKKPISFCFDNEKVAFLRSDDDRLGMTGIISRCLYDELGGELMEEDSHGR